MSDTQEDMHAEAQGLEDDQNGAGGQDNDANDDQGNEANGDGAEERAEQDEEGGEKEQAMSDGNKRSKSRRRSQSGGRSAKSSSRRRSKSKDRSSRRKRSRSSSRSRKHRRDRSDSRDRKKKSSSRRSKDRRRRSRSESRSSRRRRRSYSSSRSRSRSRARPSKFQGAPAGFSAYGPGGAAGVNPQALAGSAAGVSGIPGLGDAYAHLLGSMGIPGGLPVPTAADKVARELFIGNTPTGTSEFVLMEFLNAAMKQVNLNIYDGNPIITCRVSSKYAFIELRCKEETNNALSLNGIPFMGQMLKVARPGKYVGPMLSAASWQSLTGQGGSVPNTVDPATKIYRELYIGNTTAEMNEVVLQEFLAGTMEQVGLSTAPGNPIVTTRCSGSFAFVELRSVQEAANMLNLNGVPFMGQGLKINRPAKYPGPPESHLNWEDILAKYMAGELIVQTAGTPTRVIRLSNMVTAEDLAAESEIAQIEEETKEECEKFGQVTSVHIPKPSTSNEAEKPGVGFVFVEFATMEAANKAMISLRGRTFDNRKVQVWFWDEQKFRSRDLREDENQRSSGGQAASSQQLPGMTAAGMTAGNMAAAGMGLPASLGAPGMAMPGMVGAGAALQSMGNFGMPGMQGMGGGGMPGMQGYPGY